MSCLTSRMVPGELSSPSAVETGVGTAWFPQPPKPCPESAPLPAARPSKDTGHTGAGDAPKSQLKEK